MNRLLIISCAALLFLRPAEAPSCGPFFPEAIFTPTNHPIAADYSGRGPGILYSTFWRRHLVTAYRVLNDRPLTPIERGVGTPAASAEAKNPAQEWAAARSRVFGMQHDSWMRTDRNLAKPEFASYANCLGDSLFTAAKTLEDRARRFGASSVGVKNWLSAQETVFKNCGEGQSIPSPAEPGLPPLLRADREYQIAAAYFYSEGFDEARRRFQAIARDAASPWREMAPYLAARCLIRKASLGGGKQFFVQAKQELDALGTPAARALSQYVESNIDPEAVLERLGAELDDPGKQTKFQINLNDLTFLLDKVMPEPGVSRSPMIDWIVTFQTLSEAAWNHALERWRTVRSHAWLVVVLSKTDTSRTNWRELLALTDQIPRRSPAYATLTYHRLRLLMEAGEKDRARSELDSLLGNIPDNVPDSAINQFRAQRMELARNMDEFLGFSARKNLGDGTVVDAFDRDSAAVFNYGLPLVSLRQASASPVLPSSLRIVLRNMAEARTSVLQPLAFNEAYRLLKLPGHRMFLGFDSDTRAEGDDRRLDSYRNNWWCEGSEKETLSPPAFLSDSEKAALEEEWTRLRKRPIAAVTLGRTVIDYAKTHRDDLRSPEALHLTVRATRYSCDATSPISRQAFQLLHQLWPKSDWAAKTPYYY